MSKALKYIFSIALLVLIVLNIYNIRVIRSQSLRLAEIESSLNGITNLTQSINNNILDSTKDNKTKSAKDIMSPTELAQYLNIDIDKVYKLIIENKDSKFPRLNINGEIRFSKKAIDEYMLKGNKNFK